jgi:two-component system nitrogen regulation sensor histidine kinase NtrY
VEGARLKAWTDMARRVAHELKNPLTPMRMAATTFARSDDPGHAESGRILLEEIGRLDEMARTFSQFGRMPEGPPSEVDLAELFRALADRHAGPSAEGRRVEVRAEDGLPTVRGHYEVLSRAFRNLLVNALEAVDATAPPPPAGDGESPEAPAVTVVLDRVPEGVRVRVRDRGPGIPEAILETLWEPDVTTKRRGTGLGLAIVRQAVDAHGGRVAARNLTASGTGAEFEVVLPTEEEGAPLGVGPAEAI